MLDLDAVHDVGEPAIRVLRALLGAAAGLGVELAVVGLAPHPRLARGLGEAIAEGAFAHFPQPADLDAALEWCEERLLQGYDGPRGDGEIALGEVDALRGLDPGELAALAALATRREYAAREILVREGDPAQEIFLLVAGRLDVYATTSAGALRRLTTLAPGSAFGESALVEDGRRTALVRAEAPSVCWTLRRADLEAASTRHPGLQNALLRSLLRSALGIHARLTRELARARRMPS